VTWEIPLLMQIIAGKIIACTARHIFNDSESLSQITAVLTGGCNAD